MWCLLKVARRQCRLAAELRMNNSFRPARRLCGTSARFDRPDVDEGSVCNDMISFIQVHCRIAVRRCACDDAAWFQLRGTKHDPALLVAEKEIARTVGRA